jgi:pimeloyl-ACP methyl ester carboxylesterase
MPTFILDLRSASQGGAVVPARLTLPAPTLDVLQHCANIVFLVHGFNVSRQAGTVELEALAANLPALGTGAAVAVLWPGDSSIGPLSYPFETNKADDSAVELAKFIADSLPQKPRLSLIGHSLGCRVVMETVRQLWIRDIAVAQVCLMAAAMDNDSLAVPEEYREAAAYAGEVCVLYSPADQVLQYAYPLGNLLSAFLHWNATSEGALGYTGPRAASAAGANLPGQVQPVGIPRTNQVNHGDYLPGAGGQLNNKQRAAARFADAMLAGTVPLTYD